MGWERTKATTTELPEAPSFIGWLLAGGTTAVVGVLLFILHASDRIKVLALFNIWWLAFSPVIGWFFLFCLRGWLWGRVVNKYQFLRQEAEYGQQQWEAWAGRHLVVLSSSILLPSGVTSDAIANSGDAAGVMQHFSLTCHFEKMSATDSQLIKLALTGVHRTVALLPDLLPLNITIVADSIPEDFDSQFRQVWREVYPEHLLPASVSVCKTFSFAWIEERIRRPVLDVDLIVILQTNGKSEYSDALATILLTSDDVASKHQLSHSARILRPMPLDMENFRADMGLFLETQTIASKTPSVFCDSASWCQRFADIITVAQKYQTPWASEEIDVLEKYNGIPGAGSAWLLATLVSEIVDIRKTPILGLFTSGNDRFVSTITSGSENNYAG